MSTIPSFKNIENRQPFTEAQRTKAFIDKPAREAKLVDGVFEGGGALGTAYVGGLRALQDNGFWFKRVAGNSAGAITAALIATGFTALEIQYLSSAFLGQASTGFPASLTSVGITSPLQFADFLDLPNINSISQQNKRNTLLWKILKGTVIDEIGRMEVPIPTQSAAVNACVQGIMSTPILGSAIKAMPGTIAENLLRGTINTALAVLPNDKLHISDFMLNTENLQIAVADTLWDAVMRNNPLQLIITNLVHEGSIFEGTFFLDTIKTLFGKKVHNNPDATVLFKDLKIPLVVIASDIDTGTMLVYSSKNHPEMVVAEAVRQSMSIPFVFQPQGNGKQIVDGGLCSNFPVWVYSASGNSHWNPADIDSNRVKVGFSLDENKSAPSSWNVQSSKFTLTGNPPHVDSREVFQPILIHKLIEMGMPKNLAEAEINWALFGGFSSNRNSKPAVELLQEIIGVVTHGVLNTEEATRKVTVTGLMHGLPYIDIPIPLLGYHSFDFYINQDEAPLMAMWDRAWRKTIDQLLSASANSILAANIKINNTETPFN